MHVLLKRSVKAVFNAAGLEIKRKRDIKIHPLTSLNKSDEYSNTTIVDLLKECKRYHLGCGLLIVDNYVNIDGDFGWLSANAALSFVTPSGAVIDTPRVGVPHAVDGKPSTFVLAYDLRNGIPARRDTLETIYHCHFLEHLTSEEGRALLEDCYRCLARGGTLRVAVPDFELWCKNYLSDNTEFFNWYRSEYLGNDFERFRTKGSIFMGMVFGFEHKMHYDFHTIEFVLAETGFRDIKRAAWGVSEAVKNIGLLEGDSPRRFESLIVECTKP